MLKNNIPQTSQHHTNYHQPTCHFTTAITHPLPSIHFTSNYVARTKDKFKKSSIAAHGKRLAQKG
jgi:hypothetical protein